MTVGERIKQVRLSKKITQAELGEMIGVGQQTIFKYESGVIANIPLDKFTLIADALGADKIWLLGLSEEESIEKMQRRVALKKDIFGTEDVSDELLNEVLAYAKFRLEARNK